MILNNVIGNSIFCINFLADILLVRYIDLYTMEGTWVKQFFAACYENERSFLSNVLNQVTSMIHGWV